MDDKNPKIEIYINYENYIPGSEIKGSLNINNFKNIIVKSLKLILSGEIKNDLDVNNIVMFNETISIFKLMFYYDFVNNKFLHKNINNNFLLTPCKKNINISLSIPELNLPCSYNCKYFSVNYKLIISLNYLKITSKNKIKNDIIVKEKELYIIPLIYSFDDKYLIPNIISNYTKLNKNGIYGILNYSLFIPYRCYIPGDKIPLELKINNLINVNNFILITKISLKKQLIFIPFFDYMLENKSIFEFHKKITYNKYNTTIIKFNEIQIPYDCIYSILSNSTNNIFELKYVLKVNILIFKDKKYIPLKESIIPITIGSYRTNNKNTENIPFLPKYEITT